MASGTPAAAQALPTSACPTSLSAELAPSTRALPAGSRPSMGWTSNGSVSAPGSAKDIANRAFAGGGSTTRLRSQSDNPHGLPAYASDGALGGAMGMQTRQSAGPSCMAPSNRGWGGLRYR